MLLSITVLACIQDSNNPLANKAELTNDHDILNKDRELYLNATFEAKQKVSTLVLGVLGRARQDFQSLESKNKIDFSSILYHKVDFVEPSDIQQVNVREVIDNVISILHFKLIARNINFSFEDVLPYKVKTDPVLLEFLMLSIIQRVVEGLTIGKKIHFKFQQTEKGYLQIIIEDNGYEVDFFDFKLNTLLELDVTSIKLLGYKLDCIVTSESFADKNVKKIIIPPILEKKEQLNIRSNVIDFSVYKNAQ